MNPGYVNLQPIAESEVLARDRTGDVRAPEGGRVLMPLYQEQGDDGFFVVREFAPFWLRVSEVLRRIRADRIVHWLPGVRRDPRRTGVLRVDRGVARWYALEILHLLGFRKQRERDGELVVLRRPPHAPDGT
jgi:succinylglutamate desuccinylase